MKLIAGLILSVLFVQALALPAVEDPSQPEHLPVESKKVFNDDRVENFRREIDYRFTRFQAFYDLTNIAMRNYRLAHVEAVTVASRALMHVFGEDIDYIRESIGYVNRVIDDVLRLLGGTPNACLRDVQTRLAANSITMGAAFQECSIRANRTASQQLYDVFYPRFDEIQRSVSTVPLLTVQALSRGNVFEDEQEIIDYLESQYNVITMQWLGAVSQLFRWETNRWNVETSFYVEEMLDCTSMPLYYYSNTNTLLMFTAWDDCRPL